MKALEEKILKEGTVVSGNILKVGSFLNQQIDPEFMTEIGKEIYRLYKDSGVTKIFTIEAGSYTHLMRLPLRRTAKIYFFLSAPFQRLTCILIFDLRKE